MFHSCGNEILGKVNFLAFPGSFVIAKFDCISDLCYFFSQVDKNFAFKSVTLRWKLGIQKCTCVALFWPTALTVDVCRNPQRKKGPMEQGMIGAGSLLPPPTLFERASAKGLYCSRAGSQWNGNKPHPHACSWQAQVTALEPHPFKQRNRAACCLEVPERL